MARQGVGGGSDGEQLVACGGGGEERVAKTDGREELRPRGRPPQDLEQEPEQDCHPAHQRPPRLDAPGRRVRRGSGGPRRVQPLLGQLGHACSGSDADVSPSGWSAGDATGPASESVRRRPVRGKARGGSRAGEQASGRPTNKYAGADVSWSRSSTSIVSAATDATWTFAIRKMRA
ncbi:hypothetical protein B296_00024613, partial [Ensete ventricosum]